MKEESLSVNHVKEYGGGHGSNSSMTNLIRQWAGHAWKLWLNMYMVTTMKPSISLCQKTLGLERGPLLCARGYHPCFTRVLGCAHGVL